MNLPLITIGFTCYNAEDTIERAVACASGQTWPNVEILVVDDCSTDGSWSILRELAAEQTSMRIVRTGQNGGVGAARARLVDEARGEFLAFFDDDDESAPERLEQQFRRISDYEASHSGADVLCYSNGHVVPIGGGVPTRQRFGIGRVPPEPGGILAADHFLGLINDDGHHCWGMAGSGTLMARTNIFRKFGGFDPQFRRCEELDLAVRAAQGGAYFISVDKPLITQYLTEGANKGSRAELRYRLLLLEKYKSYLQSRGAYLGAVANMRAWFCHANDWRWRGWGWRVLAVILLPWPLKRARLERVRARILAVHGGANTREPSSS